MSTFILTFSVLCGFVFVVSLCFAAREVEGYPPGRGRKDEGRMMKDETPGGRLSRLNPHLFL